MASKSNIEWTGHTWNPLAGCSVLTPGCTNCYAMKLAARLERMGQPLYAGLTKQTKGGAVWTGEMRRASEDVLQAPLRRRVPTTYFVNSMSDLFHENVPDEWIDDVFRVMASTPRHTYQILTKRADRMRSYVSARQAILDKLDDHIGKRFGPLPNVWLGVSTEDQKRADERIPELLQTPAAVRFISAEPLLGPIDLTNHCNGHYFFNSLTGERWHDDPDHANPAQKFAPGLDWVIVGGESGHGHRHMDPAWAQGIHDQCIAAGVPVFIKQMSGRASIPLGLLTRQFPETRAAG